MTKALVAAFLSLVTTVLVAWWMLFLLRAGPTDASHHKMVLWEGSFLLALVVTGGIAITVLTLRDQRRFDSLRFFFSTFSHDLKTSISRLRLQAEVLGEEAQSPRLQRLLQDINRLDLQLENSLWMANLHTAKFIVEDVRLSDCFTNLRLEFPELNIRLAKDATLLVDRRSLLSVLRNLLQNSVLHGKATEMKVDLSPLPPERVRIEARDNGLGMQALPPDMGSKILNPRDSHSNGIGLYLTRSLVEKMRGRIRFASEPNSGFTASLELPGRLA